MCEQCNVPCGTPAARLLIGTLDLNKARADPSIHLRGYLLHGSSLIKASTDRDGRKMKLDLSIDPVAHSKLSSSVKNSFILLITGGGQRLIGSDRWCTETVEIQPRPKLIVIVFDSKANAGAHYALPLLILGAHLLSLILIRKVFTRFSGKNPLEMGFFTF